MTFTIFPPKLFSDWREATLCVVLALFPCWLTGKLNQFIACMLYMTNCAQHGWAIVFLWATSWTSPEPLPVREGSSWTRLGLCLWIWMRVFVTRESLGAGGSFYFGGGCPGFSGCIQLFECSSVKRDWNNIYSKKSVSFDVNYLI